MEKVKERLMRAATALNEAGLPYAVIGGNAVAAWVSTVDEEAVRNTKDVDILVRRSDFAAVKATLERQGFVHQEVLGVDLFLDGPDAKLSQAVHVLFADEIVKSDDLAPNPPINESEMGKEGYRIVHLEALVRMKLISFRDKDRTHLRDMIGVGLIDSAWPARFRAELAARLQQILDNPDG